MAGKGTKRFLHACEYAYTHIYTHAYTHIHIHVNTNTLCLEKNKHLILSHQQINNICMDLSPFSLKRSLNLSKFGLQGKRTQGLISSFAWSSQSNFSIADMRCQSRHRVRY